MAKRHLASGTVSRAEARRIGLAAQGFNDPACKGAVDRRHLRRAMRRLGLLQLDSVPVIIRTQYMPLFSRLGFYKPELLDRVAYTDDEWFEVWAHEASLVSVDDEPLFRWAKERARQGETWGGLVELADREAGYVDEVLGQVRNGPLAAGDLTDPRPRDGEWWGSRSIGSLALDWLFRIGEVGIRRTSNFAKQFDLLDNIVPAAIRNQPTPTEAEAHRALLLKSAASYGIGTAADLVDYYRLPKRDAKLRLVELVEDGALHEVAVEGWSTPAYLHPDAVTPRRIMACTLLSPFDPVVWFRDRASRLFDFDYRIEIYVPKAKRQYGYYVMPFLLGDQIVGRVDLKTDRATGHLRVLGSWAEPGVDRAAAAGALADHLDSMRQLVGVDEVDIAQPLFG